MCLFIIVLLWRYDIMFWICFLALLNAILVIFYVKISKDLSIIQAIIIEFVLMLFTTNFIDNYTLKKSIFVSLAFMLLFILIYIFYFIYKKNNF
ncbi:hypothetical protein, partial [Parvimonas micra]